MTQPIPQALAREIQKHTGTPWWNGEAYVRHRGYPGRVALLERGIGEAIDDLYDVIEWLRDEGRYEQSDRVRTVAGRLARLQPPLAKPGPVFAIRDIARGWK